VLTFGATWGLCSDLTMREGNCEAVEGAIESFGRLGTVVACAGLQRVAPIEEFPEDRRDAVVALLLTSPFLLARYAWPHLRVSGSGRFVAIASVHGLVASPFKAAYVSASTAC
jgi:3-hydroxybutyrate dehydrogenase